MVLIACSAFCSFDVFSCLVKGLKCDHKMCRQCCRDKCYTENLVCVGHKYRVEGAKRKKYEHPTDTENVQPV